MVRRSGVRVSRRFSRRFLNRSLRSLLPRRHPALDLEASISAHGLASCLHGDTPPLFINSLVTRKLGGHKLCTLSYWAHVDEPIDSNVNDLSDDDGRAGTDHDHASRDNDRGIRGLVEL